MGPIYCSSSKTCIVGRATVHQINIGIFVFVRCIPKMKKKLDENDNDVGETTTTIIRTIKRTELKQEQDQKQE